MAQEGAQVGMLMGILGASAVGPVRWATIGFGVVLGIDAVLASPDRTVLAIRSLCTLAAGGLGFQASQKISPSKLRLQSLFDNPRLHQLWTETLKALFNGKGKNGKILRDYLDVIESGKTPSTKQLRKVFESVWGSFQRRVDNAIAAGEKFPGYSFETMHHWNWYLRNHAAHVLDPRNLFPMTEAMHEMVHTRATQGPITNPSDIYFQPINPRYIIRLDHSYPLPPM